MSEPTLQDCINYMRRQIKQMEKHPRNYEFNLPYYRKTVKLLERRKTNDETFEWCHDCKEYDQKNHCCHRWTKVIRDTVEELEQDRRPHGEWIPCSERLPEIRLDLNSRTSDTVFVCLENRTRHMAFYCDDNAWRFCESGEAKEPMWDKVIAWMPIPEPYKEEGE